MHLPWRPEDVWSVPYTTPARPNRSAAPTREAALPAFEPPAPAHPNRHGMQEGRQDGAALLLARTKFWWGPRTQAWWAYIPGEAGRGGQLLEAKTEAELRADAARLCRALGGVR